MKHSRGAVAVIAAADFMEVALASLMYGAARFTLGASELPVGATDTDPFPADQLHERRCGEAHTALPTEALLIAAQPMAPPLLAQQQRALPTTTVITIVATTTPTVSGFARHINTDQQPRRP